MLFSKKKMVSEDLLKEAIRNTERAIAEAQKYKHLYELCRDGRDNICEEIKDVFTSSIDEAFNERDYLHDDKLREVRTAILLKIAHKSASKITEYTPPKET